AGRRGNADRAAAVTAVGHRHDASGDYRRRAAARSRRAALAVPGIARRTKQSILGGRRDAELRRVGLAEDDEPGTLVTADQLAVVARHQRLTDRRPIAQAHARVRGEQVLQQEGYAAKRPVRQIAERPLAS